MVEAHPDDLNAGTTGCHNGTMHVSPPDETCIVAPAAP